MNRLDTLTATVDQLQAEVDRLTSEIVAWAVASLGLAILLAVLAWQVHRR